MKKRIPIIIVFVIMAGLLVWLYFNLSNREDHSTDEVEKPMSKAQELLMRNLETNYPPSPREVLKYYNEITMCFYSEPNTDEEIEALGKQIRGLYDDELVANQAWDSYIASLKNDILEFKGYHRTITAYKVSSSLDIENSKFTYKGRECCKSFCYYTLNSGGQIATTTEIFIFRKDEAGHWKILGWDLAEE
ncbi:MAG: hypothetical protein KBS85_02650 [Lachnospiraceae bacterium]|nr:hypothetical protein [Candidatus Merdinaster equi]